MSAVLAWLTGEWPQVRPNLEASVIWAVPTWALIGWHHLAMRRHVRAVMSDRPTVTSSTATPPE